MPKKELTEPNDVDPKGNYKLRVEPELVRQLVRLGAGMGLYWTAAATMLLTEAVNSRSRRVDDSGG